MSGPWVPSEQTGILPVNRAPIDAYTLLHLGAGAFLGLVGLKGAQVAAIAIAWELAEYPLKELAPGMFARAGDSPHMDTPQNAILDAAAMVTGHWLITSSRR